MKTPRRRQSKSAAGRRTDMLVRFGAALQERRVLLGITQRRFSELSGLQLATISKIESGDVGVKLGTLKIYLDLLNLGLSVQDTGDGS